MFKTALLVGAIAISGATAALANSPPIADNFQPFMWQGPQVIGRPMTARELGMLDRVSKAPAAATSSAAYVARYAPTTAGPASYAALYEGRAAFAPAFAGNRNKPVEWTGGKGGHSDLYGNSAPIRPFETQQIRTSR